MMSQRKAIVVDEKDNVASALANLNKGETVEVTIGSIVYKIQLISDIPFGHKFALKRIPRGEYVIKYGEVIGRASRDIEVGEHVHVHNVESLRARGDLQKTSL
ncbi:MAG: UxaA family hydrolase [Nitrososphaeria archaeon]|nr:UxaA family hydrolase [Nitrososphaeria archaeon]